MSELEWLKFLFAICEANETENSWIVNEKKIPIELGTRAKCHGKEQAYHHIKLYINDRIKEIEHNVGNY